MKYLIIAAIALLVFVFSIYKYLLIRKFPTEAVVDQVIDGDTVKIEGGRLVRYIGIDAPETRKKKNGDWTYEPQPFADEAKFFNMRLVKGKKVRLEYDAKKEDMHGRLLAYVFLGDLFVNCELIRQGYALSYFFPPNLKYADRLMTLENEARENDRNVWRAARSHPLSFAYAGSHVGEIRMVEGKVRETRRGAKIIRLYFGTDWRRDFHVTIFLNMLDRFGTQGISPAKHYKGKRVRVSGLIKEFDGCPEMVIIDPSQIEVLEEE